VCRRVRPGCQDDGRKATRRHPRVFDGSHGRERPRRIHVRGGNTELVVHGETRLARPEQDETRLAENIVLGAQDGPERIARIARARRKIEVDFKPGEGEPEARALCWTAWSRWPSAWAAGRLKDAGAATLTSQLQVRAPCRRGRGQAGLLISDPATGPRSVGRPVQTLRNRVRPLGNSLDFRIITADRDRGDNTPFRKWPSTSEPLTAPTCTTLIRLIARWVTGAPYFRGAAPDNLSNSSSPVFTIEPLALSAGPGRQARQMAARASRRVCTSRAGARVGQEERFMGVAPLHWLHNGVH